MGTEPCETFTVLGHAFNWTINRVGALGLEEEGEMYVPGTLPVKYTVTSPLVVLPSRAPCNLQLLSPTSRQ